MLRPTSANAVIAMIRARWDTVLNPQAPEEKWEAAFRGMFPDYPIWNDTDFNYDKCHTYFIVFHKGPLKDPGSRDEEEKQLAALGGSRSGLYVAISVVAPYYQAKLLRRTLTPAGVIEQDESNPAYLPELHRLKSFLESMGYTELPPEILQTVIPDVELDLAPRGEVTVYNCLFYDED